MSERIATFTDENWQSEVLNSAQPVLVDFWAEWCIPCRTLSPIVEAVAAQFGGRLKVGKLNVEENAQVPYKYDIRSLPTLLVLKGGQVAEQRVGLVNKENLIKLLEPHLS
jgi:thioredoxin 1